MPQSKLPEPEAPPPGGNGDGHRADRAWALITGASAGIGLELAKLFAADGHDLVLVARRRPELEATALRLTQAHGVRVRVLPEDLVDPGAPGRVKAALDRDGVEPEYLVNNAGFGAVGAFVGRDLGRELEMVQVNVLALIHLTGLVLPGMVARRRGRILNIGSTAGFQPGPYMAVYYATKAFVNSFTEALAYELDGTGVTATLSCPGATATEFSRVAGIERSRLFRGGARSGPSSLSGPMAAPVVARHAYRAMLAGQSMAAVPGLWNKLLLWTQRFVPRRTVRAVAASLNQDVPAGRAS